MATQFDILHHQAEAAARNAAARAEGALRRDASLVNQASRWAGRAMTEGQASLRSRAGEKRRGSPPPQKTETAQPQPVRPAPDGYVRRSPGPAPPCGGGLPEAAGAAGRSRCGGDRGRLRGYLSVEPTGHIRALSP